MKTTLASSNADWMSLGRRQRQALFFTGAVMEELQRAYAERALQQNDSK